MKFGVSIFASMMLDRGEDEDSAGLRYAVQVSPPRPLESFATPASSTRLPPVQFSQDGAIQKHKAQRSSPSQVSGRFPERTCCTNISTGTQGESTSARPTSTQPTS